MSELVEFAKTGNLARVRECVLEDGCDVNFRCPPDGSTALYWAACSGHVSVCDWLINNGAEIDMATTKSGSSALHGAADRGHYDCVALLLRRGSETDRQTTANGDTALHLAAYRGDLSVCRLLLGHGATTSIANKQGRTALEESQIKDHNEVSRLIVQHNLFMERLSAGHELIHERYVVSEGLSRDAKGTFEFVYQIDQGEEVEELLLSPIVCVCVRLVRNLLGCLSEKISRMDSSTSEFASAKDVDKSENLFPASSSQFASEYADLHRPKLHAEDPCPTPTTLSPSKGEQWSTASTPGGLETSEGFESFETSDHLGLQMDDVSSELVRHLRTKISALESYTDTLLIELTARDDNLERLRRDNALLRQQLDAAKAPNQDPQEAPSSAADLCAASEGGAPSELEELKRRCKELEQVVYEVSQELRNCDRRSGAPKDDGDNESRV